MPDNTDSKPIKEELLSSSPLPVDDEEIPSTSLSDEEDGGTSSTRAKKGANHLNEWTVKSEESSHTSKITQNSDANTDNNQNKNKLDDCVNTDTQLKRIRQAEENETNDVQDKFMLKISNFPTDWDFSKVHAFLLKEYGPVNVVYMAGDDDPCCVLEFTSLVDCKTAQNALHDKVVEDERLIAEIRDSYTGDSDDETSPPRKKKRTRKVWRPDIDIWEKDPRGMYSFTKQYLDSLGIKPPIDRWVHVSNFRCEKSELKEALELAGEVLLCCVDNRVPKSANVMYSHPIEAVQAVSMLNYQPFYGQPLTVSMQTCAPGTTFLPKGLSCIGPGLGCDGKPLRDIVKQFERFVTNKQSFVNSIIFSIPNKLSDSDADDEETPKKLSKIKTKQSGSQIKLQNAQSNPLLTTPKRKTSVASSSNGSLSNPVPARIIPKSNAPNNPVGPLLGPGPVGGKTGPLFISGPKNVGLLRNSPVRPIGPNVGPLYPNTGVMGPVGPTPGPMCPSPTAMTPFRTMHPNPMPMGLNARAVGPIGPNPGFMNSGPMGGPAFGPGPMPNGPQNVGPMYGPMAGPMRPMTQPSSADNYVTVELSNLPLSTTFPLLCEKMALCGQVMSIQLTAPGCAVVQFAQRMQAEKCFQQYNNCCILGNMVKVQFLG